MPDLCAYPIYLLDPSFHMTIFNLDSPSTLPARIGAHTHWQVAAQYHIASKSRWGSSKSGTPYFYPATVVSVEPSREFALVRYHDDCGLGRVPADRIVYPVGAVPSSNRCKDFTSLVRAGQMPAPVSERPPLPAPSTARTITPAAPQPAKKTPAPTEQPASPPTETRTFEMDTPDGGKCWTIQQDGQTTTTAWGPRGTKPTAFRTSTRSHCTSAKAATFVDDIIASKLAKGYREVPQGTVAKWAQKCSGCGSRIAPGDSIKPLSAEPARWAHAQCPM